MIETERLILRSPEERDRNSLRALWSDPRVMADIMPSTPDIAAAIAHAAIARIGVFQKSPGCGAWVVEERASGAPIGFYALRHGEEGTPAAGQTEAGWLFAPQWWGKGLAREAVAAMFCDGWQSGVRKIVAIASVCNEPSQVLMRRLGMHREELFESLRHPPGDRLRPSIMYAIEGSL